MNLKEISKIPYKEKRLLVNEACLMYKKLRITKNIIENTSLEKNDVVKTKNLINVKSTSMFEVIISLLSKEYREIIFKEFINKEDNSRNWYEEFYSKSTFYKLKHEAMDNFLFLLFA